MRALRCHASRALVIGCVLVASRAAAQSTTPPAPAPSAQAAPETSVPGAANSASPQATGDGNVLVQVSGCEAETVAPDRLVRALDLELAALGLRAAAVPAQEQAALDAVQRAPATVELSCNGRDDLLMLRVSDAVSGHEISQQLDTRSVDSDARPRTLALAVVSLLEASWGRAALAPRTQQAPLPQSVRAALAARLQNPLTAAPKRPELNDPRAVPVPHAQIALALRSFPGRSTGLVGLHAAVVPSLGGSIALPISAEGLYGTSDLSDAQGTIGSMDLYLLSLGLGLDWVSSKEPLISIGPELRIGATFAKGDAEREDTAVADKKGVVLAALIAFGLRMPLDAGYYAVLGADLGWVPVGVVFLGDAARLSGTADATFGLRIGIAR